MSGNVRLIFMHIPKTAGISMTSILRANYRGKLHSTRFMWQGNPDFHQLGEHERAQIEVLCGHMPFGIHEKMGEGKFEYFTLLRDPVERVLSAHHDILTHEDHFLHRELKENQYGFAELAANGKWLALDNCQVRMLSGDLLAPFGTIGPEHLQAAQKNIAGYFPLIGVQPRFDELVLQLAERYGWNFPYYKKLHVSGNRRRTDDLQAGEREAIRSCNQYDQQLYDSILARVEAEIAAGGEALQERLARFRRRNRMAAGVLSFFFPGKKPAG